jgi:hypothetical protein
MSVGRCTGCGEEAFVGPLQGSAGGRMVCVQCVTEYDQRRAAEKRKHQRRIDAFGFGANEAGDDEFYLELLEDAIRLTHPDRHPEERRALAQRVTAELLALRPFVKPRPKQIVSRDASPKGAPRYLVQTVTLDDSSEVSQAREAAEASRTSFPCKLCRGELPGNYCNACQLVWHLNHLFQRAKTNAAARARRARKKMYQRPQHCVGCGLEFKARKDKKYCTHSCRQQAYRNRLVRVSA